MENEMFKEWLIIGLVLVAAGVFMQWSATSWLVAVVFTVMIRIAEAIEGIKINLAVVSASDVFGEPNNE